MLKKNTRIADQAKRTPPWWSTPIMLPAAADTAPCPLFPLSTRFSMPNSHPPVAHHSRANPGLGATKPSSSGHAWHRMLAAVPVHAPLCPCFGRGRRDVLASFTMIFVAVKTEVVLDPSPSFASPAVLVPLSSRPSPPPPLPPL